MKVNVVKNVLKANDIVADNNRAAFKEAGVLAVNFISSPGSGKTTLLQKTISALLPEDSSAVIVGDLQTTRDADRLAPEAKGVVQINTGLSCHLYANQVSQSLDDLKLEDADFLFIENVGNMVCPGEFDLGENAKVILLSLPEGDDKIAKYPTIFRVADMVLLTKCDLAPHLNFDMQSVRDDLAKLNVSVPVIELSSVSGQGMESWIEWLRKKKQASIGVAARFVTEE